MTKAGQHLIEAVHQAALWTKATRGGTELPTEADRAFLGRLNTHTATTSRGLRLLANRAGDRSRQRCRRLGWVVFAGPCTTPSSKVNGWLLTEAGRAVLETRVHVAPQAGGGLEQEGAE